MAIRHKRKSTTSYTWTTSDLVDGQIGINTTDGTLHIKNHADTAIFTIGGPTNVDSVGGILAGTNGGTGVGTGSLPTNHRVFKYDTTVSSTSPTWGRVKLDTEEVINTLPIANGGTGLTSLGTGLQVLRTNSGATAMEWATPTTGTVTSVSGSGGTTGLTLTGGAITSSGTLTLGGTLAVANGGTGITNDTKLFTLQMYLEAGANNTYILQQYATFPYTIQKAYYQTTAGTITANVKIGSTSVTSLSALSLSSTPGNATATAANTVVAGNLVQVTFSGNSASTFVSLMLDCVRT